MAHADIYEITASGFSCGSHLNLCKSVAEPFGDDERLAVMKGMRREFFNNAAEDGDEGTWQISFQTCKDLRLIEMIVEPKDKLSHWSHVKWLLVQLKDETL